MRDFQDDTLLIERFQRGDHKAMDALIQKHQARAYQYAYRLTKDVEEASDVVSEAFVRVYRALGNFKGESAFTTWLYRILTNCYLDMRKKQNSRRTISLDDSQPTEDGDLQLQVEDTAPTPHQHAESRERIRTISAAVDELPEYQKAMIMMYHVEMLSYEEIAESLDLPIGTVKSRLNRARTTLRERLSIEPELFAVA